MPLRSVRRHGRRCRHVGVGGGFVGDGDAQIRRAPALSTSASAPFVFCATPAVAAAGARRTEVSLNALDESNSTAAFTFYPPPHLAELSPNSGPAAGGTDVALVGANFSGLGSQPVCRFGVSAAPRAFGSQSALPLAYALDGRRVGLAGAHGVGAVAAHGLAPNSGRHVVNATLGRCTSPLQ